MGIELVCTLTLNTATRLTVFHCKLEDQVILGSIHCVNLFDTVLIKIFLK